MQQQPVKKRSFKRLSFFKSYNIPSIMSTPVILTTNTINKEYDVETGNKIINNYMIIKEIGRGMHGKVKLAQDLETGELVAIKIVDKTSRRRQLGYNILKQKGNVNIESEQKIRREIAILKKCLHPHVVQLRQVIDDPTSKKIYLVLEYMEGGEIIWRECDESTEPYLTIDESREIFRDVVCGLDYLHYQGIIHRDIKPANLLYTKDHIVKISDFGVSYFNQHLIGGKDVIDLSRELAETAGTPAFFAPELCSATEQHITKSIDIWALGVTLYCLIFGQCPFIASTEFELFDLIPTQPLKFPFEIEQDLKQLLLGLLEKDPNKRLTLDQVKKQPWVTKDIDVELWLKESDPTLYQTVIVTDQEVSQAVTMMDKLRKSIHRISSSLSGLTLPFKHHTITEELITPSHSLSSSNSSDKQQPRPKYPFQVDRNQSSSSSMSGLVVNFNRTE